MPAVLVATMVAVVPWVAGPAGSARPGAALTAKPGAGPVQRVLPVAGQPFRGVADESNVPLEPGRVKAAGAPSPGKAPARPLVAGPRAAAAAGAAAGAAAADDTTKPLLRRGYLLGDTSLMVYFNADVAGAPGADPASWTQLTATVTDVATGAQQQSVAIDRTRLSTCGVPRQYCQSFGVADGWSLTSGRSYTATVSLRFPDGTAVESVASDPATPRTTVVPASVPAAQASGCACPNVLTRAPGLQALRGDAVNTATGALVRTEPDLSMASFGIPFQAVRLYSSSNTTAGMFGPGWSWTYDVRVVSAADGSARVRAEDGTEAVFAGNGAGGYTKPAGVSSTLAKVATGWTLSTVDRRVVSFDASGKLVSIVNQRRQGVTLAYDAAGHLQSLTDAAGRTVTVSTDAAGLVTGLRLPDGRQTRYAYQTGRLATVRDARDYTWRYAYDAAGRLVSMTDQTGVKVSSVTYDAASGRVSTQADAEGAVTKFEWDAAGQVARTTDADGVAVRDGYRDNVLLYTRDGKGNTVVVRYDPALNRNLAVDAQGNQTDVEHDADGNVTQVRAPDPFGYVETNSYTSGNLDKHVDAEGHAWTYTYNATGEMTGQTDPDQADAKNDGYKYSYDDRGLVKTRTDPRGKVTTYEYDTSGNRTAEVAPTGRRTEFGYDLTSRLVTVTDPRGTVAGGNRALYTTRIGYDDEDRVVWQQTAGKVGRSRWTYDRFGAVVEVSDQIGRSTRIARDKAGRVTAVTDPKGGVTRWTYTPAGRTSSTTDAVGSRTTWTYDPLDGRAKTETSPRGNQLAAGGAGAAAVAPYVTTFTFDPAGNLLRSERPYPGGGGKKAQVDAKFDELNRPTVQWDELGRTTRMAYDGNDNLTDMYDEAGNHLRNSYDKSGRRTGGTTDTGGAGAVIVYDEAGLVKRQTSPTGGVTTWSYDDDGRPVGITEPRGNVAGADPAQFTTRYGYDLAGNLTSSTDPLGNVQTRLFDPSDRVVKTVDGGGATTTFRYDDADQLLSTSGPVTGAVTRYSYDANGNTVKRWDPLGRLSRVEYDAVNRPVEQIDPLGRNRRLGYDADGNLTTTRAGSAIPDLLMTSAQKAALTTTYTYDSLGRMTARQVGSTGPKYTYGYDAGGRLTSYADPTGLSVNEYDTTGRLKSVTRGSRVFSYIYEADGDDNIATRTYPDGTRIAATYDDSDRMRTLTTTRGGSDQRFTFDYDPADRLTSVTYPASVGGKETFGYDRAGRLNSVETTSGAGYLGKYDLVRDAAGNPTQVTTTRRTGTGAPQVAQTTAYSYDAGNRLSAACYGATGCGAKDAFAEKYAYQYDLKGNRTKQTYTKTGTGIFGRTTAVTDYHYDAADQLTKEILFGPTLKATTYDYDGEGNQTRAGNDRFTYNLDHTLATATVDGQQAAFSYDASGNRIASTVTTPGAKGAPATRSTRFWEWDVNNALPMLAVESATSGDATTGPAAGKTAATTRAYTYGLGGMALALHTAGAGAANASVYSHDWLAGTSAVLSSSGATQWTYDYDPFGNPRAATGATLTAGGTKIDPAAPVNPLQYTGAYNDQAEAATTGDTAAGAGGNYHLRARDYDPSTGRFTGTDPAPSGPGSVSAYLYTGQQPTVLTDPSGMRPADPGTGPAGDWTVTRTTGSGSGGSPAAVTQDPPDPDPLAGQLADAQKAVAEAGTCVSQLGDELMSLVADLIGITDARKCITEGDVGACVSTALNFVPWGKLFKAAKVAWKAVGLGRRMVEGYTRLRAARAALETVTRKAAELRAAATKAKQDALLLKARREADAAAARARAEAQRLAGLRAKARQDAARARAAKKKAQELAEREKIAKRRAEGASQADACPYPNSFTADTLVVMADGTAKPISQVRPGDAVLAGPEAAADEERSLADSAAQVQAGAADGGHPTTGTALSPGGSDTADHPDTLAPVGRQVAATITGTGVKHLIDLTLVGAGSGGGSPPTTGQRLTAPQRLTATEGHPIWTTTRGWVRAGDLAIGDRLTGTDGATSTITALTRRTLTTTVHNLTIDDRHTYYVLTGTHSVLVHNCGTFTARAGDLANRAKVHFSHPVNDEQMLGGEIAGHGGVRNLSNEELIQFGGPNGDDPITAYKTFAVDDPIEGPGSEIHILAGHHRTFEIGRRVREGLMDPGTIVTIAIGRQ